MMSYFPDRRKTLTRFLTNFMSAKSQEFKASPLFGQDLADKILAFTLPGKMIRGGLVYLAAELYGGTADVTAAAAAMELIQSGFLVHDDIMDRDYYRRGQPSLFARYGDTAAAAGAADSRHAGEGLGICAGDACFFLAQELLSRLHNPEIIARCGQFLTRVCLAQMEDVWYGCTPGIPAKESILNLYINKTGCYTFSLPLTTGALAASAPEGDTPKLERLGETMGILFQTRDDALGLFGDEGETGKPVGSDIREGKKTLWFRLLHDRCDANEKRELMANYGNPGCGATGIESVRSMMKYKGVEQEVDRICAPLKREASGIIESLTGRPEPKRILRELLDYCSDRTK
jgi:geranylgeranyl diphosphate synthase type I